MRYDTKIYFQRTNSTYNASTGNYDNAVIEETMCWASVKDSGTDTLRLVYGELKQGGKTIALQRPYTEPFDRIRIGNTLYSADFSRKNKTFIASEVQ